MLKEFESHIQVNFPFLKKSNILIAVSGGVDSVVLTHLCYQLKLNIALAHCNFNLRGKESDADEKFVEDLANDLGVEVFCQSFDTEAYAKTNKLSTQMAARELRYQWFNELQQLLGFDYILTAHHSDDNLETFLINFIRGSGLEGLTGIPEINKSIVRPLLVFSRKNIEDYAKTHALDWREDASNESVKYIRNRLRHEIIPVLKEINPQLLNNFAKTLKFLRGSKGIVEDRIDEVSDTIMEVRSNGIYLNIEEIKNLNDPHAYLYELLNDFGFTEWDDVTGLLDAQSGKYVVSESWRLLKDRNFLILSELKTDILNLTEDNLLISENIKGIDLPIGKLTLNDVNKVKKSDINTIYVDKDVLNFPLSVRRTDKGDVFYPFGMKGKKKVSKYFKDEKFSLLDKENTLLLCSGDKIIWIIGQRADNRFKVKNSTKQILKITLT